MTTRKDIFKKTTSIICAAALFATSFMLSSCKADNNNSVAVTKATATSAETTTAITSITQTTTFVKNETTLPPFSTAKTVNKPYTKAAKNNSSNNGSKAVDNGYKKYDYSDVSSNGTVGDSYFKDAIFLGNSIMLGLKEYTDIKGTFYSKVSLNVDSAFTTKFVKTGGKTLSAMDAVKRNNKFTKVYIMFGTNELGWEYPSIFIEKYEKIIDTIRRKNPDAVVYVLSILPVTKSHSDSDKYENIKRINKYNKMLIDMSKKKGATYLDVGSALSNDKGYLPESASFDGIHIGPKLCKKWVNFLKTHAKTSTSATTKPTTTKTPSKNPSTHKPTATKHTPSSTIPEITLPLIEAEEYTIK